jgi:hypothetical protein
MSILLSLFTVSLLFVNTFVADFVIYKEAGARDVPVRFDIRNPETVRIIAMLQVAAGGCDEMGCRVIGT